MPDLGLLRGVITLVTLLTFIGICWWAYRPANRARFEKDGLLAFEEEENRPADENAEHKTEHSTQHSTEGSQA
jgi:cytochrome c oxidase cbb3-type subunit 4